MKLGIIGGGVVGRSMTRAFVEHVDEVRVYDVKPERRTHADVFQVLGCDVVMICLPTPQREGSLACNTDYVEEFLSLAASFHGKTSLVLRSTVPVGFTCAMVQKYGFRDLVHSPEYLTARCALTDAQCPSRMVVGLPKHYAMIENCSYNQVGTMVRNLYRKRWPHVPLIVTDSETSEFAKLMQNSFFATKVAFFNEMYQSAWEMKVDWETALGIVLSDGRIHPSHTNVPGPDGKLGFGGTCLPKDLASTVQQMHQLKVPGPYVTLAALERNKYDRQQRVK